MLEELRRRNYAESTSHTYVHAVEHFSQHFHRPPDLLGSEHRDAALGSPALFLCPSVEARLERCRNAVSEEGFAKCAKKVAADPDCHLRACALKCEGSGFGIVTKDQQFLKFDAAGNAGIVEALKTSDKKDHLRVDVSGDVQGDTLKVTSVKLL